MVKMANFMLCVFCHMHTHTKQLEKKGPNWYIQGPQIHKVWALTKEHFHGPKK